MFKTPILLLVFNRPEETKQVFEAIRKRAPVYLYIAADGPRKDKPDDQELCENVRQIIGKIDWSCEVKTLLREQNLGCRRAVSGAITWFFQNVEQGIILEDDCVPDYSFFDYCEQLLVKYKYDESIFSIGGTNLGYTMENDRSYSFSRFMNMWGWATWRRAAGLVDYNMVLWKNQPFKIFFLHWKLKNNFFLLDYNWIKYWKSYFSLTAAGKIDTWDYQWIFTQLYYNKVSVFPAKNLVRNIGFSDTATHTFHPGHVISKLQLSGLDFPLKTPASKSVEMAYENYFIKKVWFNYRKESFYSILRSDILNAPIVLKIIKLLKEKNIH